MQRSRRGRSSKRRGRLTLKPPGSAPGTLIADPSAPKPVISVLAYGPGRHEEVSPATLEDIARLRGAYPCVWVNISGLGDAAVIKAIGDGFELHALALEDVLSGMQRPKCESFEDNVFIVIREPHKGEYLDSDQVSMFIGSGYLVTFQEHAGDCFDGIRQRVRGGISKISSNGTDFLAYSLIDAVIDAFFPILEQLGEKLDTLEDEAILHPSTGTSHAIHDVKRELLNIRRAIWPAREAIGTLIRDPLPLISENTRVHLRDCYDHLVQLVEVLENYREIGSDLQDIYLSSMSNRLNEVMKVLTIIATIFMPLSWIAGVYGMNFHTQHPANMPELGWRYGYIFALAIMAATAGVMVWYFWRKGWIWKARRVKHAAGAERT